MNNLAPIALFVHARLDHTKETIQSLLNNPLAEESTIYIFSDNARLERKDEATKVELVRNYINSISGFKSIKIIYRDVNYGLKRNIVEGLNQVLESNNRVIVIEDDCVTSANFLEFMNNSLEQYKDNNDVWHISAWNPGVDINGNSFPSYYMSCWGWATWRDNWKKIRLNPLDLMEEMTFRARYRFNLNGKYPFYSHLLGNYLGINNTWAVFWYASIYNSGGYCINSPKSLIKNLGMDGTGSHNTIIFNQDNNKVSLKPSTTSTVTLEDTLIALSNVFKEKQSRYQYVYTLVKMLTPIWVLKFIKHFKD
ncbi:sugar transferase [Pseudocolwellia sp. HL-MZ19]|uniref:sugar transferase n=1 Tax=Pseudocolwellia sp. HL-MZ19 TaxID=3400846 RepID=UPI003CF06F66